MLFSQPAKAKTISLLIVDESPLVRAGIRFMVGGANDIEVVAEASTLAEARFAIGEFHPWVALVSIHLCSALSAHVVSSASTCTALLAMTQTENDFLLARMQDAGVVGYITGKDSMETLISAIRRAAQGEVLFTSGQLMRARRWKESVAQKWGRLTGGEQQLVWLMLKGVSNEALAQTLNIPPNRMGLAVTAVLEKLMLRTRQDAVNWMRECFYPDAFEELPCLPSSVLPDEETHSAPPLQNQPARPAWEDAPTRKAHPVQQKSLPSSRAVKVVSKNGVRNSKLDAVLSSSLISTPPQPPQKRIHSSSEMIFSAQSTVGNK